MPLGLSLDGRGDGGIMVGRGVMNSDLFLFSLKYHVSEIAISTELGNLHWKLLVLT